ncbi:MAG: exonuclease SbcCD subunit D, partial [Bradymonadaceae bacterium]
AKLYEGLAAEAERQFPGVPRVATGHLTCYAPSNEPEEGDYHSAIHGTTDTREVDVVGNIGAMPPSIFGDRYAYVALGHIHRLMRVGDGEVWYSGTPVATSIDEKSGRHVLQVEIDGDSASVESVAVPTWRRLIRLEGTEDEIADELDALERTAELPPYLFLHVELDRDDQHYQEPEERLREQLEESFPDADRRPRIVAFRLFDPEADSVEPAEDVPSLEDLSDREVFIQRYQSKVGSDE